MPDRDHGGNLDTASARYGGTRDAWLDLPTGINPMPYPRPDLPASVCTDVTDVAVLKSFGKYWGLARMWLGVLIAAIPQAYLARRHIWTRAFMYNYRWLRLGRPLSNGWPRLEVALADTIGATLPASVGPTSG